MSISEIKETLDLYGELYNFKKKFEKSSFYKEAEENNWDINDCFNDWLRENEEVQDFIKEIEEDTKEFQNKYSYYGVSESDFH